MQQRRGSLFPLNIRFSVQTSIVFLNTDHQTRSSQESDVCFGLVFCQCLNHKLQLFSLALLNHGNVCCSFSSTTWITKLGKSGRHSAHAPSCSSTESEKRKLWKRPEHQSRTDRQFRMGIERRAGTNGADAAAAAAAAADNTSAGSSGEPAAAEGARPWWGASAAITAAAAGHTTALSTVSSGAKGEDARNKRSSRSEMFECRVCSVWS